jgi:glycosyltransferase involved in cell wall biosynthesis
MIVEAFSEMPERRLVVIGDGPDMEAVRAITAENVEILGRQPADRLIEEMQSAKALIFAAEEDFGIVPVEALACGTPVIAYRKGGVTESVVDGEHGIFFDEQTEESLIEAIDRFEAAYELQRYDPDDLHQRSLDFSNELFAEKITERIKFWADAKWPGATASSEAARKRNVGQRNGLVLATTPATSNALEQPSAEG